MAAGLVLDKALRATDKDKQVSDDVIKRCRERAKTMLAALAPQQRAMVLDLNPHVSALCPRRAGKTFAAALAALITGEMKPGAISLIISLNLKQLRRLYWSGSASGLYTLAKKFNLNLTFHGTYLRWDHENGSIGYLLGCEDDEQMEVMRGMEADLYVIDECKSFAPGRLAKLVDDILDPQRSSRDGRIIMIGTPGFIAAGPFYQATCDLARDKTNRPFMIPAGHKDQWGRDPRLDLLWSFHTWSPKDNPAKACQNAWRDGLIKKKAKGWADDHPTWLREYLGRWTAIGDGLVFRYALAKSLGKCSWVPEPTKDNSPGLPEEGAPWRFIAGLDLGYQAPTAFVVCAYSRTLGQLRQVWESGRSQMLVHDVAEMISEAYDRFGSIEMIYADQGNLGKTIIKTLVDTYGFPIEAADKREKFDYIELLNAGFEAGEVLIIENTTLEEQLLTNAWDLDEEDVQTFGKREVTTKEKLARQGRLVEDKDIPNDFSDAMIYCYRGSMHHFKIKADNGPPVGSDEWKRKWEREQFDKFRKKVLQDKKARENHVNMYQAPPFVRRLLQTKGKWNSLPKTLSVLS